ncbi:hypothetical protein B0A54_08630 [Friedmanniomyces endolithicus]|uniref:Uncharacterized protein n=1 Tax=Friedmanniomyces endolithicus TaxID=329885 RepID=A0A4U0URQ0_9PEZI|nr:hypothetical protein B0A54_08630 [Friedmanniomyces endolithicus]
MVERELQHDGQPRTSSSPQAMLFGRWQAAAGNSSNATLLQPNKARIRTAESAGSRTRLCEEGGRLVCNRLTQQKVPESREVCGSCRHSCWVWMKTDLEASLLIRHRLLQTW